MTGHGPRRPSLRHGLPYGWWRNRWVREGALAWATLVLLLGSVLTLVLLLVLSLGIEQGTWD